MWYGSNLEATPHDRQRIPHAIRYAESADGVVWERAGQTCIQSDSSSEVSFTRPSVIISGNRLRMWYSYRGNHYRIGYAESQDGRNWSRKDSAGGLDPSGTGWEKTSTAYPCVFEHQNQRFLLYNGDDYGRTGFGLGVAE